MACNACRRRKVKCDAEYPKCRNCRVRNDECLTEDPRRPDEPVVREWIEGPLSQPQMLNGRPVNGPVARSPAPALVSASAPVLASALAPTPGVSTNASTTEAFGISPVYHGHDMAFNMDHESNRIKMMGASSSQTLMKSLDVYLKAAGKGPLLTNFVHQMQHCEEVLLPNRIDWPPLPNASACEEHLNTFFNRIHCVYPIFDVDHFKGQVRHLSALSSLRQLPAEQIPVLASSYLVMSLGMDEQARRLTNEGTRFLDAAASLLSHVIMMPYLASVQCLLLFAIAYRGRNKDGVGWQMLGLAIRIAHTLGIHRFSSVRPSHQHAIQVKYQQLFHARIWGICCCLEKIMQLESGRPSAIAKVDRDQMMGTEQRPPLAMPDFLQWHVGLAEFQGQISHHLYDYEPGMRSTAQLLLDTAKLDAALLAWTNEIPSSFRPGSDMSGYSQDAHAAAHLSMQYHQTMIALHRAALVAPTATFEREISTHCPDQASLSRLRKGESICVNSARSIARLAVELVDSSLNSRLLTCGPPILACIVLSIYLMKSSVNRLHASDLELLRACAESTSEQCLNCGMDPRFSNTTLAMYEEVKAFLQELKCKTAIKPNSVPPHEPKASGSEDLAMNTQPSGRIDSDKPIYYQSVNTHGSDENSTYGNELSHPVHLPQSFPAASRHHDEAVTAQNGDGTFDGNIPFTGLNVEDLWNWMLIADVNGGIDDLPHMEQTTEHIQAL